MDGGMSGLYARTIKKSIPEGAYHTGFWAGTKNVRFVFDRRSSWPRQSVY
jgi:hypothetical protein